MEKRCLISIYWNILCELSTWILSKYEFCYSFSQLTAHLGLTSKRIHSMNSFHVLLFFHQFTKPRPYAFILFTFFIHIVISYHNIFSIVRSQYICKYIILVSYLSISNVLQKGFSFLLVAEERNVSFEYISLCRVKYRTELHVCVNSINTIENWIEIIAYFRFEEIILAIWWSRENENDLFTSDL